MSAARQSVAMIRREIEKKKSLKAGGKAAAAVDSTPWKSKVQIAINAISEHDIAFATMNFMDTAEGEELRKATEGTVNQLVTEYKESHLTLCKDDQKKTMTSLVKSKVKDLQEREELTALLIEQIPDLVDSAGDRLAADLWNNVKSEIDKGVAAMDAVVADAVHSVHETVELSLTEAKEMIVKVLTDKPAQAASGNAKLLQFDEAGEIIALREVYKQLEIQFVILADCEERKVLMEKYQAENSSKDGLAAWQTDSTTAASMPKPTNTVKEQLDHNAALITAANDTIVKIITVYSKDMKVSQAVASKQTALSNQDLTKLKELKLSDSEARMVSNGKKLMRIIIGSMMKEPLQFAAVLPALIAFLRSNVAINRIQCLTLVRVYNIQEKSLWNEHNEWGIAGDQTCERFYEETQMLAAKLISAVGEDVKVILKSVPFGNEDSERGIIKIQGEDTDGCTLVEIWKFQQEWLSEEQIEMHKMKVLDVLVMFYDQNRKLSDVLSEAMRITQTGIDFGAEVPWSQTGAMWAKAVAATHAELETTISLQKLKVCKDEELRSDCITLLPTLLADIELIATEKQRMDQIPREVDKKHNMHLAEHQKRKGFTPRFGGGIKPTGAPVRDHDSAVETQEQKLCDMHYCCLVKGCSPKELNPKDMADFRAYKFNMLSKHPNSHPKPMCGVHRKEHKSGKSLVWKNGQPVKPLTSTKNQQRHSANVIQQQQPAQQQAANPEPEPEPEAEVSHENSELQTLRERDRVGQMQYQHWAQQMQQNASQMQMMNRQLMLQQNSLQANGVQIPGVNAPTMGFNIPPPPPSTADSQVANFVARPQAERTQPMLNLDSKGNVDWERPVNFGSAPE